MTLLDAFFELMMGLGNSLLALDPCPAERVYVDYKTCRRITKCIKLKKTPDGHLN